MKHPSFNLFSGVSCENSFSYNTTLIIPTSMNVCYMSVKHKTMEYLPGGPIVAVLALGGPGAAVVGPPTPAKGCPTAVGGGANGGAIAVGAWIGACMGARTGPNKSVGIKV